MNWFKMLFQVAIFWTTVITNWAWVWFTTLMNWIDTLLQGAICWKLIITNGTFLQLFSFLNQSHVHLFEIPINVDYLFSCLIIVICDQIVKEIFYEKTPVKFLVQYRYPPTWNLWGKFMLSNEICLRCFSVTSEQGSFLVPLHLSRLFCLLPLQKLTI